MGDLDRRELLWRAGAGALAVTLPPPLMPAAERAVSKRALRRLASSVRGPVIVPDSGRYAAAARVYNQRYDGARPDAVVQPLSARDVQAVLRWANRYDVNVVARSGGHSYAGYSTTSNGVVVDLRRLRRISASRGSRSATVGAGAQLIDIYAALARQGATIPAGSCPSVGIGGLAQGGGMGLASRRFGLTCDNITGLTIVTADGGIRRVDEDSGEDLFWACRGGGGGNFGVTGFEFATSPARRASYFAISWPWAAASEALAAWQQFAPDAPDALTALFSLSAGGPQVNASGQFFGTQGSLRRLLAPLLRVGSAQLSTGSLPYLSMMLRWAGCSGSGLEACHTRGASPGGTLSRAPFHAKSDYVNRPLSSRARARMIASIEQRAGGSGSLLLDAYGGAINRIKPDATAFVHRDALFSIQYLAYGAAGSGAWVRAARRAMRPHVSGEAYQNYIDPDLVTWRSAYYGENYERLAEIKKAYDPDGRFRFKQAIGTRSSAG